MKATIKTKRFITCPVCGEQEWEVEHRLDPSSPYYGGQWGPLRCNKCTHEFNCHLGADDQIEITDISKSKGDIACLFRFRDLYIIAGPFMEFDNDDHIDHFFHSHICPVSILHSAMEVYDADYGSDPHGVLRFIASVPYDEVSENGWHNSYTLERIFQVFKTDGMDALSEWPEEDHGVMHWLAEMQRAHKKTNSPKA